MSSDRVGRPSSVRPDQCFEGRGGIIRGPVRNSTQPVANTHGIAIIKHRCGRQHATSGGKTASTRRNCLTRVRPYGRRSSTGGSGQAETRDHPTNDKEDKSSTRTWKEPHEVRLRTRSSQGALSLRRPRRASKQMVPEPEEEPAPENEGAAEENREPEPELEPGHHRICGAAGDPFFPRRLP